MATQTQTSVMTRRPRWKSIFKWIGLYLLAQLIAGGVVGFFKLPVHDGLLSAAILTAMIVRHNIVARRERRAAGKLGN